MHTTLANYRAWAVDSDGSPDDTHPIRWTRAYEPMHVAYVYAMGTMTHQQWQTVTVTGAYHAAADGGTWTFTTSDGQTSVTVRVLPAREDRPPSYVVLVEEPLHPVDQPFRVGEQLTWDGRHVQFRRIVSPGLAHVMDGNRLQAVEVGDLERPEQRFAVELEPDDVARIFQALGLDADRISQQPDPSDDLADVRRLLHKFAALHP